MVAVDVTLAAPLEAEPAELDGVATIMARALTEGTDKHSAEEFAAELVVWLIPVVVLLGIAYLVTATA